VIRVWWIGSAGEDAAMTERVRARVEAVFKLPAELCCDASRPVDSLDLRRGQHSSGRILEWLLQSMAAGADASDRVLGITDADLFIPVLTFVYGEAQLDGRAAVASTARLRADGAKPGDPLVAERLVKESLHELGHAFGLRHCVDARCMMSRSASLPGVDAKRDAPCDDCRLRLAERRKRRTP